MDLAHRPRSHPYATLFYPSEPLVGLPAFHDGSIVPALARELAFGASEVCLFLETRLPRSLVLLLPSSAGSYARHPAGCQFVDHVSLS